MNKPSRTFYNDDDALAETLRRSKEATERKITYAQFEQSLREELPFFISAADSKQISPLPQAWGMLIEWIKSQQLKLPLRKPLATYLLGFISTTGLPSTDRNYRYRFTPKRALVQLAPKSDACREGIAICFEGSCIRILQQHFPQQREKPQEIYGEAIVALFENLPRKQEQEKATLFTYFMVIARRKYSRYLQKLQRQFSITEQEEEWENLLRKNDTGDQVEELDYADVLAECQEVIKNRFTFNNEGELVKKLLPLVHKSYQEALKLRFLEDQSYEEIGAQLGDTADYARTKVHRGLRQLRKLLNGTS